MIKSRDINFFRIFKEYAPLVEIQMRLLKDVDLIVEKVMFHNILRTIKTHLMMIYDLHQKLS